MFQPVRTLHFSERLGFTAIADGRAQMQQAAWNTDGTVHAQTPWAIGQANRAGVRCIERAQLTDLSLVAGPETSFVVMREDERLYKNRLAP